MTVTFIAYATPSQNELGADAGISIYRKVIEDGQVREEQEIANWSAGDGELDAETGETEEIHNDETGVGLTRAVVELDDEAFEAQLAKMGYQRAGTGSISGGQLAVEVEPAG